ncbi:MAG TPA: YeeE/YedE family protein [Terriglobales bacterium]|nr:YeeE/YedE family protein [Terriglobales bacterium]
MRQILAALVAGLLFGTGLVVSGMSRPEKVLGFLDIGAFPQGSWDPSLAFVMAGALLVAIPGFALARRRAQPAFDTRFHLPSSTSLDGKLILGAVLFGIGWGLVGYCPGPALTALLLVPQAWPFIVAMMVGMILFRLSERHAEGNRL